MPVSRTLKNIIFLILFIYTVCVEEKFVERSEYFKPFISVPLQDSFQQMDANMEEEDNEHNPQSFANNIDILNGTKVVKCMYFDTETLNIYDISGLSAGSFDENDNIAKNEVAHIIKAGDYSIYTNFCYNLKNTDDCPYDKKQAYYKKNGGKCEVLADGVGIGNHWSSVTEKDPNNENLTINYLKIDANPEGKHKLTYMLQCDENMKEEQINPNRYIIDVDDEGYLNVTLYVKSKYSCVKVNVYKIYEFIMRYKVIFIIILMAFGLFNCLLGKRLSKYTAFLICLVVVTVLVLVLSQYILPPGCSEWIIWVMLGVGVALGITAGVFLFIYHDKVMAIVAGGVAGLFLGEFLYSFFGNLIPANGYAINIAFVVASIGVMIAIAFFFKNFIIILATSIIGSYCFIRGISLFAGGFPNEFTIISLTVTDEANQIKDLLGWETYVYLSAMAILCGLSIFAQYKINKDKDEEKDEGAKDANLKVVE